MRKALRGRIFDTNLTARAPNYLFQSGMATVSLSMILFIENSVLGAAILVAVASTAFTILVVPNSVASSPRRVIGGHVVAVVTGSIFSAHLAIPGLGSEAEESRYLLNIMAALSVGLGILVTVATNTEHPPAAGTALGLVTHEWSWGAIAFILSSAVILSVVRLLLRPKLINLI